MDRRMSCVCIFFGQENSALLHPLVQQRVEPIEQLFMNNCYILIAASSCPTAGGTHPPSGCLKAKICYQFQIRYSYYYL